MAEPASKDTHELIDELDMCCGGRKKCPKIAAFSDGSFEISDVDQPGGPLRLTGKQAALMATWLGVKLRGR